VARTVLLSPQLLFVAAQVLHSLIKLALYISRHLRIPKGGGRPGISLTIHSDWWIAES
jgi:hypothetical protein